MSVLINRSGVPSHAEIRESSGHDPLDQAALAAVSCFRYQPGTRDGAPADMRVRVPINFVLEGGPPGVPAPANFIYRDAEGNIHLGQRGFWDKFIKPGE